MSDTSLSPLLGVTRLGPSDIPLMLLPHVVRGSYLARWV